MSWRPWDTLYAYLNTEYSILYTWVLFERTQCDICDLRFFFFRMIGRAWAWHWYHTISISFYGYWYVLKKNIILFNSRFYPKGKFIFWKMVRHHLFVFSSSNLLVFFGQSDNNKRMARLVFVSHNFVDSSFVFVKLLNLAYFSARKTESK